MDIGGRPSTFLCFCRGSDAATKLGGASAIVCASVSDGSVRRVADEKIKLVCTIGERDGLAGAGGSRGAPLCFYGPSVVVTNASTTTNKPRLLIFHPSACVC